MPISDEKTRIISRCVLRLIMKNSSALHLMGKAVQGLLSGSVNKHVAARVFGFDPGSDLPVEDLVAESLLNGLDREDIEEIFRRYARRKGLDY